MRKQLSTLTIVDKDGIQDKMNLRAGPREDFAWAQRPFVAQFQRQQNAGKPVRIISLKARQLGITTVTAGLNFLGRFQREGTNGLTIAHDSETTASIYDKMRLFWETWGFSPLYTPKSSTQRWLTWTTNSSLRIATAKSIRSGRGRTIHFLHGSEVAFWDDPETLMTGLRPSLPAKPGTVIVLESTANGVGNYFHAQWIDAMAGRSEFTPMFFPWWKHYEYRMPVRTIEWLPLDDYEKYLLRLGASLEHVEWRRYAIPNIANHDENFFMQEYPASPEEAFIASGVNIFPGKLIDENYHPKPGAAGHVYNIGDSWHFRTDPLGELRIYCWPSSDRSWGQYIIGADPSRTTMGDSACIQVLHRGTFEQMAVWHGKCDPVTFAGHIARIGYYYNSATVAPEIEGPGYATIGALIAMGYPNIWQHRWADKAQGKISQNYGWSTNYQRKHQAIGYLIGLLGRHRTIIHDARTRNEMAGFVALGNGEMGNADPKGGDDTVMAYAIAVAAALMEPPFTYDPSSRSETQDTASDIMGVPGWEAFKEV